MALPRSIDRPQPKLVHETADACQRHFQRLIGQQTFRMVGRYRQDQLPGGSFQWQNQQVVHFLLPSAQNEPWVSLHTKRPEALDLTLYGPKNAIGFGRSPNWPGTANWTTPASNAT
jgi:hypothetical protein